MTSKTGGCLCGKVRYTLSAEPVFTGVCHCTNCMRSSGSAFNFVVAVPSAAVAITGPLTSYISPGDSGQPTTKRFCPECGSPIANEASVMPGITMIRAGTLDDPAAVSPVMHIYCRSKLAWITIPEGVGTHEAMPMPG